MVYIPESQGIGAATTDTLTNKTIASSSNVIGRNTMTLGSDATGDIYYRDSNGLLTRLGVGANGQLLTLTAGLPSWAAAAGGGAGFSGGFTSNLVKAIGTYYVPPNVYIFNDGQLETTPDSGQMLAPYDVTLGELVVQRTTQGQLTAGRSFTITLYKNGVATGLTLNFTSADAAGAVKTATASVAVAKGDKLYLYVEVIGGAFQQFVASNWRLNPV